MAQQTAVNWLIEQMIAKQNGKGDSRSMDEIFDQAKEIEFRQIMEAFDNGDHCIDLPDGSWKQKYDSPEQYYTQTYNQNNNL
jgi:hypothetical protein